MSLRLMEMDGYFTRQNTKVDYRKNDNKYKSIVVLVPPFTILL
jgi:hypothetical protein